MILEDFKIIAASIILCSITFSIKCDAQRYFHRHYSTEHDLPTNILWNMDQDEEGLYWFSTNKGIMTFDGFNWKILDLSDDLPIGTYSKILSVDKNTIACLGTNQYSEFGVYILEGDSSRWIKANTSKAITSLFLLTKFKSHWEALIIEEYLLYRYDSRVGKWDTIDLKTTPIKSQSIISLINTNGEIQINTLSENYILKEDNSLKPFELDNYPKDKSVYSYYQSEENDTVFIINKKSIAYKTGANSFTEMANPDLNLSSSRSEISLIKKGDIIFYSSSGALFKFDFKTKKSQKISTHGNIRLPLWTQIYIDQRDNIWMLSRRGLSRLSSLAFLNYGREDGLLENEVASILHLDNGYHFIGHNHGFTVMDKGRNIIWKKNFTSTGISRIQMVVPLGASKLYAAASERGLLKIDVEKKTIEQVPGTKDLNTSFVHLRGDSLIYGSYNELFINYKNSITHHKDLRTVRNIIFDNTGKLFLVSRFGLWNLDEPNNLWREKSNVPSNNTYRAMSLKNKDTLLLATAGGLYYKTDSSEKRPYLLKNGELEEEIYSLAITNDNTIWLGTANGIFPVENHYLKGHFNAGNGLRGNEVNRNAMQIDKDSNLWIGTAQGLTILDIKALSTTRRPPVPKIERIYSIDEIDLNLDKVELNDRNNHLDFIIGARQFKDENKIEFRYRLKGLQDEWNYLSSPNEPRIDYKFLPSGTYQMELSVKEENTKWSSIITSPEITILPPFYLRWWAILIFLIIVITLIFFLNRYIITQSTNEKLEKTLQLRMGEILEYQNDLLNRNKELQKVNGELDNLIYSISHDLRAPIKSAQGLVNIYQLSSDKDEKEHYISLLENSFNRLDRFIDNILKLSRNSRLEVINTNVNVKELIHEIIESQRYQERAKDIEFTLDTELETIYTDSDRLAIALRNIIGNAINYSDHRKDKMYVQIKIEIIDQQISIKIRDNGEGIKAEYIDTIFDIFVRATQETTGSGLGLYITKESIQLIGGQITVSSEYGKWTEFEILLPNKKLNK